MTMPNSQLVMFAGNNVETVEEVRSMQLAVRCDALKANSSSSSERKDLESLELWLEEQINSQIVGF
ncbi:MULTISPECIES: hypothetical protein [Vibrio]|uniref:Uncharacterized protein n=1 Tax=Vibrio splendidus TaxID=29497 RepID=A0A2T5EJE4_VIBSP|nr:MULTISPECIES: hypothetical protein [Vibrio]EHY9845633.1 hypothetical protein [Vibrio cholerae]MCS0096510.1 hypothetical protein [Vibrio cholerae]OEE71751.1 hypothetical protein A147_12835 [Vibrio splendidus FF-6]PTP20378.1 hypothetical protein CWO36_07565 [Vibrio splendidus]